MYINIHNYKCFTTARDVCQLVYGWILLSNVFLFYLYTFQYVYRVWVHIVLFVCTVFEGFFSNDVMHWRGGGQQKVTFGEKGGGEACQNDTFSEKSSLLYVLYITKSGEEARCKRCDSFTIGPTHKYMIEQIFVYEPKFHKYILDL